MTRLPHLIALLAVGFVVAPSTDTVLIPLPTGAFLGVTVLNCDTPTVICDTATVVTCPPCVTPSVVISTGPWILMSPSKQNCYRLDGVNENGTPTKPAPWAWVPCP